MVRVSVRRNTVYVARKQAVAYKQGSVCFVLSKEDCMPLVQFYALLLKIDRRMAGAAKAACNKKAPRDKLIKQSKIKGSHISGPFILSHNIKSRFNLHLQDLNIA
jgi:hypothetical protein